MRGSGRWIAWAAALALAGTPVRAQVSGHVRDPAGNPVVGATVELWRGLARLSQSETNTRGEFRLDAVTRPEGVVLAARAIGYSPTKIDWEGGYVAVILVPSPVYLPQIGTSSAWHSCPLPDSREARERWKAARSRYIPLQGGVRFTMAASLEEMPMAELGSFDRARLAEGRRGMARQVIAQWNDQMARGIYATVYQEGGLLGLYDYWRYAPLEAELAPHFVSEDFGTLHTFSHADAVPDGIVFCSRRRTSGPVLSGFFRLTPHGDVLEIGWRFHDSARGEVAGGSASFALSGGHDGAPLLPAAGSFWRVVRPGVVRQLMQEFVHWELVR